MVPLDQMPRPPTGPKLQRRELVRRIRALRRGALARLRTRVRPGSCELVRRDVRHRDAPPLRRARRGGRARDRRSGARLRQRCRHRRRTRFRGGRGGRRRRCALDRDADGDRLVVVRRRRRRQEPRHPSEQPAAERVQQQRQRYRTDHDAPRAARTCREEMDPKPHRLIFASIPAICQRAPKTRCIRGLVFSLRCHRLPEYGDFPDSARSIEGGSSVAVDHLASGRACARTRRYRHRGFAAFGRRGK